MKKLFIIAILLLSINYVNADNMSIQDAKNNTTLATSHLYNFSSSGMGGLFSFYGSAANLYDNTTGVSLSYTC